MSHENFCYWLQGLFELNGNSSLTEEQVKMIKEHLSLTFVKVTPTDVSEPLASYLKSFDRGTKLC